jgi:hypothetical protein
LLLLLWHHIFSYGRIHDLVKRGDLEGMRGELKSNPSALNQPDPENVSDWGVSSIISIELKYWEQWKYEIWSVNWGDSKYRMWNRWGWRRRIWYDVCMNMADSRTKIVHNLILLLRILTQLHQLALILFMEVIQHHRKYWYYKCNYKFIIYIVAIIN